MSDITVYIKFSYLNYRRMYKPNLFDLLLTKIYQEPNVDD